MQITFLLKAKNLEVVSNKRNRSISVLALASKQVSLGASVNLILAIPLKKTLDSLESTQNTLAA